MDKKYISVDVETTGAYPWRSSILSIGACVVGNVNNNFYSELKPITKEYVLDNFKIGASSLNLLKDYNFNNFDPLKVLNILEKEGEHPKKVMKSFYDWILKNSKGFKPVLCATPVKFDGMFLAYYFDKFIGKDPFGHTGEDIQSIFRGNVKNLNANLEDLSLRENGKLRHNALEDAIQQAKEFYVTLVHMGEKF